MLLTSLSSPPNTRLCSGSVLSNSHRTPLWVTPHHLQLHMPGTEPLMLTVKEDCILNLLSFVSEFLYCSDIFSTFPFFTAKLCLLTAILSSEEMFFLPSHGKKDIILNNLHRSCFLSSPFSQSKINVIFVTIQIKFFCYEFTVFSNYIISVAYIMYLPCSQHFSLFLSFSLTKTTLTPNSVL